MLRARLGLRHALIDRQRKGRRAPTQHRVVDHPGVFAWITVTLYNQVQTVELHANGVRPQVAQIEQQFRVDGAGAVIGVGVL